MKILKKLSLRRGFDRIAQPSPIFPKWYRSIFAQKAIQKLLPSQQLHKYGVKPPRSQSKFFMTIVFGCVLAYIFKCYKDQLYKNELDTIYRYRYHEEELSFVKLKLRMLLFKFFHFLEFNFFLSGFMKRNKNQLEELTQGYLRYAQYENYVKNKDKKFDLIDIGLMDKYPYAKPTVNME